MIKLGAVPISSFLSTFMQATNSAVPSEELKLYENLLIRTTEPDYLEEDYEQAEMDLSDLVVRLMEIISSRFTIAAYECITLWLEKAIVNEVYNNHENSKHAGTIIEIIKKIMKKAKP